jgi:hypothetical protein
MDGTLRVSWFSVLHDPLYKPPQCSLSVRIICTDNLIKFEHPHSGLILRHIINDMIVCV